MSHAHADRPVVLVVEDEVLVRLLITDVLQEEGHFKVIEAKNATEALRVLEARPDVRVLFTDAEMPPGPNGFELAREVCHRFPYVQIIISSGRMRPGADEMPTCAVFIPKPWTSTTLIQHVKEAAGRAW